LIYYLSNTCYSEVDIIERNPIYSEAGRQRTKYLVDKINKRINIISFGLGKNIGYFERKKIKKNNKLSIVYLNLLNIPFIRYFWSFFVLFIYLFKNLNNNDKIIIYNCQYRFVIAIFLLKVKYDLDIIVEFEEFYSRETEFGKMLMNFFEKKLIKNTENFILTNKSMLNKINKYKNSEYNSIISFGYFNKENVNLNINNNKKKYILYSGRYDKFSGVDILLKSINYIDKNVDIIFTGKDFENVSLDNYNNQYVTIINKGFLSLNKYNELLSNANICLNPINTDYNFSENSFPSKLVKYLSFGNRIISTELDCLDQLGDLQDYIYIYNNNPQKLGILINELLEEPFSRYKIKNRFLELAQKEEEKIKNFFEEIL